MSQLQSVLVVGATGQTGRCIVKFCAGLESYTVKAHVRPNSSKLRTWGETWQPLGVELDTTEWTLSAWIERFTHDAPDFVFLCLGTTKKRAAQEGVDGYETVDWGMTHMVIEALVTSGAKSAVGFVSSAGASVKSLSRYLSVKGRCEAALVDSGLAYVIARPSIIDAPRDDGRPLEKMGLSLLDGALSVVSVMGLGSLRERYRSISAEVLGAALARALLSGKTKTTFENDRLWEIGHPVDGGLDGASVAP